MAHVYRHRVLSHKLRFHFGLFHHFSISESYNSARQLCFTTCHGKTPTGNSKSYPENDPENDLDFFGVAESDKKDSRKFKKISDSEKNYIHDLVEKYAVPTGPKNIQLKTYGSIRYDHKIPKSEQAMQPAKQTRKQRRLNRGVEMNQTDSSPASFILHYEKDVEKTEGNVQGNNGGNHSLSLHKNEKSIREDDLSLSRSKDQMQSDRSLSFIDKQYFSYDSVVEKYAKPEQSLKEENQDSYSQSRSETDLSFIDEQYFNYNDTVGDEKINFQTSGSSENIDVKRFVGGNDVKLKEGNQYNKTDKAGLTKEHDNQDLSFIDEQYFSYNNRHEKAQNAKERLHESDNLAGHRKSRKHRQEVTAPFDSVNSERIFNQRETNSSDMSVDKSRQRKDKQKDNPEMNQFKEIVNETPLTEKKQTAYDVSMKIRAESDKKRGSNLVGKFDPQTYDSKGFRILKDQVPHFENVPSIDVLSVLRKSIIFDRNDIVAISKPYGLSSHDGPGVFHSVGNLIDRLIPRTQLFPVHRLDKETTGVMLFAKTEEMANRLSECFLHREIKKKYLVITKNIPEMQSGEIDIPITEGTVEGKVRMCLRPYNSPELNAVTKKRQPGTEAITRYRVLDQGKKCALLECFPITGKKHQIRVHLALGLNCPILGDHKYSHINKIAPMKLHPEILERLKIQQSKVRYLAMHLHARSIMIPEFLNGRNLFISAPLPPHFVRNMKDLKLNLPPHC
ncbi:uncharacterized protein LOC123544342 [Mercenaria mercenaria]|uniref:uncharacterized protein LOC123544342 n=1 Tax=Mercenaria mercenaria TaxID=6596 RepID=UPI00234F1641|nr:uncharacterized protein LOC123544342 [Mercenaria mercenaria]